MASEVKEWPNRPCPCCGYWPYKTNSLFDNVIECGCCGMICADTAKTQADFDAYYSQQGRYTLDWAKWNFKRYQQQVERLLSIGVSKNARVVDVGGAEGGLATAMGWAGFTYVATCNPAEGATHRCTGAQLTGDYDLAILSHVLEHVLDVKSLIDNLSRRTKHLYVEVPDARRYHVSEVSPYQQFNEEHINHWDMPLLLETLSNSGFSVRACGEGTCEPNDFPVIWAYAEANQPKLVDAIRLYCDKSAQLMAKIERQIAAIEGQVICWGIGALAHRIEPLLRGKVAWAVDSNAKGEYCGAAICKPTDPGPFSEYRLGDTTTRPDYPILVMTILHKDSVLKQIAEMGLRNPVITLGD